MNDNVAAIFRNVSNRQRRHRGAQRLDIRPDGEVDPRPELRDESSDFQHPSVFLMSGHLNVTIKVTKDINCDQTSNLIRHRVNPDIKVTR